MANFAQLQHSKKTPANRDTTAEQFNGALVIDAFSHATYIQIEKGRQNVT